MRNFWLKMEVWDNGSGIILDEASGPITEKQYKDMLAKLFIKVREAKEKTK